MLRTTPMILGLLPWFHLAVAQLASLHVQILHCRPAVRPSPSADIKTMGSRIKTSEPTNLQKTCFKLCFALHTAHVQLGFFFS